MAKDFTKEEEEEDLSEEFKDKDEIADGDEIEDDTGEIANEPVAQPKRGRPAVVAPKVAPQAPRKLIAAQKHIMPKQQAQPAPQPSAMPPRLRYSPYIMAKRAGVFDEETKQPLMEDGDVDNLLLGLMSVVLSKLDNIEKSL